MHYYRLAEITAMMAAADRQPVAIYDATRGRVTGELFDEESSGAMVIIATIDTSS